MSTSPRTSPRSANHDWRDCEYYFDVYSSPLGWHFIVWRTCYSDHSAIEVVCHKFSCFASSEAALAACWKWMGGNLDTATTTHRDCVPVLDWLDEMASSRSKDVPPVAAVAV